MAEEKKTQRQKEIGAILSKRRKMLSFSEEDVLKKASISKESLYKIESGDFSEFPEIYLLDLLKRYSKILDLPYEGIIKGFSGFNRNDLNLQKKKPLDYALRIILIILFFLVVILVINIIKLKEDLIPLIENRGNDVIVISADSKKVELMPGEYYFLKRPVSCFIENPKKEKIVVKYTDKMWSVFWSYFEVYVKDGEN